MNIVDAEENLKNITAKFSKDTFIFDLMGAYDFPKSTISKLKLKLKKNPEDDVIVASKLHFVGVSKKELDAKFDKLLKDYATIKKQPRFIIVTDYQSIKAYDTKMGEKLDTDIKTLSRHPDFFLPWTGIEKKVFQGENPADVKAAEKLAKFFDLLLHDNIKLVEKNRHALNVFLTRILFCFFAEDTDIFEKGLFTKSINDHTNKDGNDLADYLQRLFEVLNKKSRNGLPDFLKEFPYVNGGLFAEEFPIPKFSKRSRESLIDLGSDLNWAEINPDIFGSMIQAVVHPDQRAGLGMHYTSVTNILKAIEPLFLSELKEEYVNAKESKPKLKKLLERINNIKIFDPACGSGNFLIIAYKELRSLEMKVLKELGGFPMSGISLSNFYGIEIDDFAHEVAKLSLWLAEHQMNIIFNNQFGNVKASLPLKETGQIVCGNSVRVDWTAVCPQKGEVFIVGNPPYLGARMQGDIHKEDIIHVFEKYEGIKKIDYISCWFLKASEYIAKNSFEGNYSFVSTNSICQGEHLSLIWPLILNKGLEITFAHKTFKWTNNAKMKAAVMCVILGVGKKSNRDKFIFSEGTKKTSKVITPYLSSVEESVVARRNLPIAELPEMEYGNMAIDGGNLILSPQEKAELLSKYPESKKIIRKVIGAQEYIKGIERWCLWIEDDSLELAENIPLIQDRIKKTKKFRLGSSDSGTVALASRPHQFREMKKSNKMSIFVPTVSTENRDYLPAGFVNKNENVIAPNQVIYDPDPWVLGVLICKMQMVWIRAVAGRLKSDYRYSSVIVYNNFPLPNLSEKQKEKISEKVYHIVSVREKHSDKTIAEMYNPKIMPNELKDAHLQLDQVIESYFREKSFINDDERRECLFSFYKKFNTDASMENQ